MKLNLIQTISLQNWYFKKILHVIYSSTNGKANSQIVNHQQNEQNVLLYSK